jgi:hypothetical protein
MTDAGKFIAVGAGLLALVLVLRKRDEPEMSGDVRAACRLALEREQDPAVLRALSRKLAQAGHNEMARATAARAREITSSFAPTIEIFAGQQSQVVSRAQSLLYRIGYDVVVDGVLGSRTRQALERFQSLHGLDITGEPDASTMQMLELVSRGAA